MSFFILPLLLPFLVSFLHRPHALSPFHAMKHRNLDIPASRVDNIVPSQVSQGNPGRYTEEQVSPCTLSRPTPPRMFCSAITPSMQAARGYFQIAGKVGCPAGTRHWIFPCPQIGVSLGREVQPREGKEPMSMLIYCQRRVWPGWPPLFRHPERTGCCSNAESTTKQSPQLLETSAAMWPAVVCPFQMLDWSENGTPQRRRSLLVLAQAKRGLPRGPAASQRH